MTKIDSKSSQKNILVPCNMGIGNLILFFPFLSRLKSKYIEAEVTLITYHDNPGNELLSIFANQLGYEIKTIKKRNPIIDFWNGYKNGLAGFDEVYLRFNSINFSVLGLIIGSKAKKVIGHKMEASFKDKFKNFFLTEYRNLDLSKHESIRCLDLIEDHESYERSLFPSIEVSNFKEKDLENIHTNISLEKLDGLIILSPGSSEIQKWKRWPMKHWITLINKLDSHKINFILCGNNTEYPLIKNIISSSNVVDCNYWIGSKNSMNSFLKLIKASSCLVACDTALIHFGSLFNIPTVALFGPGDENRIGPLAKNSKVIRSDNCIGSCFTPENPHKLNQCNPIICMEEIKPQEVLDSILRI